MTKTLKRPEVFITCRDFREAKGSCSIWSRCCLYASVVRPMAFVAVPETYFRTDGRRCPFAAKYCAKVYVAANTMHEGNEAGAGEWFRKLRDIGIAAVIVSDPALIMIAATEAPGLEIHLSTQAKCH